VLYVDFVTENTGSSNGRCRQSFFTPFIDSLWSNQVC